MIRAGKTQQVQNVAAQNCRQAAHMILNDALLPLTVLAIAVDDTPQRVYNLEVGGAHAYFAGEMSAWAHNSKRGQIAAFLWHTDLI